MINKFKIFMDYDIEKEEQWLNEQAKMGLELITVGLTYRFVSSLKEEGSIIKIDYRTFNKKADFTDYKTLFEDSGWELVSGSMYSGKQYFRNNGDVSNLEIFSDTRSKASRYKRMSHSFLIFAICYFPLAVSLYLTSDLTFASLLNPTALYFTPGLWEYSGTKFLIHFFIETPFVLMRTLSILAFPLLILMYLVFAYKSYRLYKKEE